MKKIPNLFLVGPMGAGKTTVGRHLANALHLDFEDSDRAIVERTGAAIPLIFELEGEAGFRKRERTIIAELTARRSIVLATGGGVVLDPHNRHDLCNHGIVIYLHAPLALLQERTSRDRNRPLLGQLEKILAQRDPLYREVADLVVETDRRSARHCVKEIIYQLRDSLHQV